MATHKSSEKRARQTPKRTARNRSVIGKVKSAEKKLRHAVETKAQNIQELLGDYMKQAMKAVSKGVSKKQTAARKISRISSFIHKSTSAQK